VWAGDVDDGDCDGEAADDLGMLTTAFDDLESSLLEADLGSAVTDDEVGAPLPTPPTYEVWEGGDSEPSNRKQTVRQIDSPSSLYDNMEGIFNLLPQMRPTDDGGSAVLQLRGEHAQSINVDKVFFLQDETEDVGGVSLSPQSSQGSLLPNRAAVLGMFTDARVPDLYDDIEQIGRGAAATVYRATDLRTSETVALKKFKTMMLPEAGQKRGALAENEEALADILTEVRIMKRCNHDNILFLRDAVVEPSSVGYTFWAALDYCFGSCFELFKLLGRPLVEHEILAVTCQVLGALEYLHFKHIMHRDIKCGNILVSSSGAAVLADFGVSIDLSESADGGCGTFVGSPYWIAPEVVLAMEDGQYSYPADVWSLGISVIEMSKTEPPNFKMHAMSVLYNIPEGPPPQLDEDGAFSPALHDFVAGCLVLDPDKRADAGALLKHPVLEEVRGPAGGNGRVALADLLAQALVARERRTPVAETLSAELGVGRHATSALPPKERLPLSSVASGDSVRPRAQSAPVPAAGPAKHTSRKPLVSRVKGFFKARLRRKKKARGRPQGAAIPDSIADNDDYNDDDDAMAAELSKISFGQSITGETVSAEVAAEQKKVAFEMRKLRQQSTRRRKRKPQIPGHAAAAAAAAAATSTSEAESTPRGDTHV